MVRKYQKSVRLAGGALPWGWTDKGSVVLFGLYAVTNGSGEAGLAGGFAAGIVEQLSPGEQRQAERLAMQLSELLLPVMVRVLLRESAVTDETNSTAAK